MGRELERKRAKRDHKNVKEVTAKKKKENTVDPKKEIKVLIRNVIIVLVTAAIAYFLVAIFVTKEIKLDFLNGEKEEESDINYNRYHILANETFKQAEESYYVFFYDFSGGTLKDIETLFVTKLTSSTIYYVDTSSALNHNFVKETGNPNVTSISDLSVVAPTLIKVENGMKTLYFEGSTNITNYLNSL